MYVRTMQCIRGLLSWCIVLLLDVLPSLVLTSEPSSSSNIYCPGQVVFTCNATSITVVFHWKLNNKSIVQYIFMSSEEYPLNLNISSPLIDSIKVINATMNGNSLNIVSELRVSNISALNGSILHCEDSSKRISNAAYVAICQGMHIM